MRYLGDYPKTKDEYWQLVDAYWEDLADLIGRYHPGYGLRNNYHKITAQRAENLCQSIRQDILADWPLTNGTKDPVEVAKGYKYKRDPELVTILNQTWFGMPESYEVRSEPGFSLLCDLCSEAYVLEEPGQETV